MFSNLILKKIAIGSLMMKDCDDEFNLVEDSK